MADLLDAPLVYANYSRLLLDLNREINAEDSIVTISEDISIVGNQSLSVAERLHRQQLYESFHDRAESVIKNKLQQNNNLMVISIHSFTPIYHGKKRPWHIGVLSNQDRRLADALLSTLHEDLHLQVGDNEPYAPTDGVYHSMGKHGEMNNLPCVMLEIRNDLIADNHSQTAWAQRITQAIDTASKTIRVCNNPAPLSAN